MPKHGDRRGRRPRRSAQALAEPRRADVVRLLGLRPRTQTGLCRDLGMAQPLLRYHLKALADTELVERTVCDGVNVYRLRADTLRALSDRLATAAEDTARTPPC